MYGDELTCQQVPRARHLLTMRVCMYVCMFVCMDGWIDGWMDVCRRAPVSTGASREAPVDNACVYVCMHGWRAGWLAGWAGWLAGLAGWAGWLGKSRRV